LRLCTRAGALLDPVQPYAARAQALGDEEPAVVAAAIGFLAAAARERWLRKRALLACLTKVSARFLRHPSAAVRGAAVEFTVAAAAALSPAELYARALPALLPALRCEPVSLRDAAALVDCIEPGAPRCE